MKVGDIVICHGWKPTENKKGFIEEIVTDPHQSFNKLAYSGRYSVYGLEPVKFSSGKPSYYYGDFNGDTLEVTGDFMTKEDLEKYKLNEPDNLGIKHDMDIVIKNLGRTSGRNEGGEQ
jgi:hypothetical protein